MKSKQLLKLPLIKTPDFTLLGVKSGVYFVKH